ncbi:MAG: 5'-nucleotidase C-terminal domain-containing protein [Eubacterium sp.]|nr:5'-nucleotidase C-terminal domain-containing protein [Eubacterium sp.]
MKHMKAEHALVVLLVIVMVLGSFSAVFADQPNKGNTKHKGSLRDANIANAPNTYTDSKGNEQDTDKNTVSISFTSDMEQDMGLYAKASTYFKEESAHYPRSFMIDAGNWSAGSPYASVFAQFYPGVAAMGKAGYDIAGIGSSEVSQGGKNLTAMLNRASKDKGTLPYITVANIAGTNALEKAFRTYGVNDYMDLNKYRTEIAVFSIVSKECFDAAAPEQLRYEDAVKTAKKIVDEIKKDEEADMIICFCSSGMGTEDADKKLEKKIAGKVKDIDIIISCGSTTELEKPIKTGKTRIYSLAAGSGKAGRIEYVIENNAYKYSGYKTVDLNDGYKEDKNVKKVLANAAKAAGNDYLAANGFAAGQVLCESFFEIEDISECDSVKSSSPFCELIADAYRYAATEDSKIPKGNLVAIASEKSARGSIREGKITIDEVYNMMCVGKSDDGTRGQAVVSFYLTGEDLRKLAEMAALASADDSASISFSGLAYKYNPHRFKESRIYDITTLEDATGSQIDLNDDSLYRIVTDPATVVLITDLGMEDDSDLYIVPKDENGEETTEFGELNRSSDKEKPLKTWIAAADYLSTFTEAGIPATYKEADGRMIYDESTEFSHVYKGEYGTLVMLGIVALIGVIAFIVLVLLVLNLMGVNLKKKKKPESK